jgi:uncharacterized protein (DUF362 family)
MIKKPVSIVRYEKPRESVRKAVELSKGLDHLPPRAKVFIKPNIVFWTRAVTFPKWGLITTSRVVEDMIILLKERGIDDISVGEGMVIEPKDIETPAHAFETLGYGILKKRYGIKYLNIYERPFQKIDFGDGVKLNLNADILNSDFVVDLPVMKCHMQTIVSLGIKNLKGMIDIPSRKKCHNMNAGKDLNFWISKLADKMPPMFTLLDGIYTNERGPGFDGRMHRSNLLIASSDVLSADMVGAKVLGYEPAQVPHLVHAAENRNRSLDISDLEVVGENIEDVTKFHEHDFQYSETDKGIMPIPLAKQGIKGVYFRKYDLSLCTYCAGVYGLMLGAVRSAWKGEPWDNVEVLTGKDMQPTPGMEKTILVGKCIYQAHKNNADIQEMIPIKGCPPSPKSMLKALHQAGIDADPSLFEHKDELPGLYMRRYEGKPEYDETFFQVK